MGYTYQQIEDLWVQNGGSPNAAPMAASIALAESGGNPGATNGNSNGSIDRGLFQVNSIWGSESTTDVAANVRAAISISSNGQNWQPWTTFQTGAYKQFYNPGVQPDGQNITDNMGVSTSNSSVTGFMAQPAQPVLSLDMLKAEAPMVAALITSVPELQTIFQNAVSGGWSTDRFISQVQNSQWWATHSDTARQAFATMKADPATWGQTVNNLEAKLLQMSVGVGANVPASVLQALAADALTGGFDTNESILRQKFAQYVQPVSGVHFGGEAGNDETTIRQSLRDLGVLIPEGSLDSSLQDIIAGKQTVQGVQSQLRTQAQATYPAYSAQIQQGMNVSDIAAPYISQAQNLLEQGPGAMNIYNPLIKNALQYTVGGSPTVLPLTQFETQVRERPDWLATNNAREDTMTIAHKVLTDMGFEF